MLQDVPKMVRVPANPEPGEDRSPKDLAAFIAKIMPQQRNQIQVLWSELTKNLPNGPRWLIDYEPSYHFVLQATEHLWGISKGDVARKPQFSLAGVIDAVQKSLTQRCTPVLCKSLIDECRRFEHLFYEADLQVFGPAGHDQEDACGLACCALAPLMPRSGKQGEMARKEAKRKCQGPCGFWYHKQCALRGGGAWEEVATTCLCGCADAGGGSDEGESESEDDDADDTTLAEEARARKKQATLQRQLEAFKSRLAPILAGRQNFNQGGSGGNKGKMSSSSR